MATERHMSTRLALTLSLGSVDGKNITKSLSLSRLAAAADAAALDGLAGVIGDLLEYPIADVKKYETSVIEAE